jgi:hypothetical protein
LYACVLCGFLVGCVTHTPPAVYYPYHRPLISPGTVFSGLPLAVQQTIRAEAGTAQMSDILKFAHAGSAVYEVRFTDREIFPPLYVASDGSVLYPDMSVAVAAGPARIGAVSAAGGGVRIEDLPIEVLNTIHEIAPTAEIDTVYRVGSGSSAYYDVIFKNGQAPRLFVREDGSLMSASPQRTSPGPVRR